MFSTAAVTAENRERGELAFGEPADLLQTKLYMPPLPPDAVARPHLIEYLKSQEKAKLFLVSAPAGFGKTTLVSEWLCSCRAGSEHYRPAWVSLEKADNDLGRFWKYTIAALRLLDPAIGLRLADLLNRPVLPPAELWLPVLIDDLVKVGFPLALVLDDYHVIHTRAIHKSLNYLLQHLPANARIILITRADPPLPLARLRVLDQLVELRATDLLFTRSEIQKYINDVMELNLTLDDLNQLGRRTEGWPAGIHLAARSLQGCDSVGRSDFIRSFNGSNRFVFNYLLEEVLQQQQPVIREFLSRTSILPQISAPLAATITGLAVEEVENILARLVQDNMFIIPLDDAGHWYRYHSLFAEALETGLRNNDNKLWCTLHHLAAIWYAANGHTDLAIDHALASRDFEKAAELIENSSDRTWSTGDTSLPLRWLERLPEAVVAASISLQLLHIWMLVLNNRWNEAIALWEKAGLPFESSSGTGIIRGRWAAIGGALYGFRRMPEETIRLSHIALAHLPTEEGLWRAVTQLNLGLAHQALGNAIPAAETYRQMIDFCLSRGFLYPAFTATAHLIEVCHKQGHLYEAQALSERMQDMENLPGGRELCLRAGGSICLGRLAYERNDLIGAESLISGAMEQLCSGAQSRLLVVGLLTLSRVAQARSNWQAARQHLDKALEISLFLRPTAEDKLIRAHLAHLALKEGRWDDVKCWQAAAGLTTSAFPDYRREYEYRVLADLLIAEGNFQQAESLLARLRAAAERGGRSGSEIALTLVYAVALARQNRYPEAEAAVRRVLPMAHSQGYMRTFLDAGPRLAELLNRPGIRQHAPVYIDRLSRAFDADAETRVARPVNGVQFANGDGFAESDHLTPREWEILAMIARGSSNQEIADRLVLSVGTVKGHVNHIFSKLDVHNRTAAVARARDFQLIES